MPAPRDEIARLREEINRHDHLYYVANKPQISDREYDRLFARLKELEAAHPELITPDSPTQRVSETPQEGFAHVTHAVPMMSIDNTYNEGELREFDGRVARGLDGAKYEYLVDPKIDGVSATLRYEDGRLVLGATRGDGRTGDDVTANLRTIRAIPLRLRGEGWPRVLEVRGEVYWPRRAFDAFNAALEREGKEPFANPRNATAGTIKQLDTRAVSGRGLAFTAHGFGEIVGARVRTAAELFEHFRSWGLPVSPHQKLCPDIDAVWRFVVEWESRRHGLDYETDGLVIKVNDLHQREVLGATSRYPRWCIAYKYAAEQGETVLLDVDFQVGKLGTITPRAVMKPVQLSGTTVKHASLHNFDQVDRLDVRIGDTVVVEKAGEIIPQVVRVVVEKRPRDAKKVERPRKCPVCKGEVVQDEGGVYIRCINPSCDAQIKERLKFFCGRDQMDIEGVGEALVEQLVDQGWVHSYADLYRMANEESEKPGRWRDRLAALTFEQERRTDEGVKKQTVRLGEKRADALLAGIERSKKQPLARVLAALNIRHVGASTAEVIAEHFGEMEKLVEAAAGSGKETSRSRNAERSKREGGKKQKGQKGETGNHSPGDDDGGRSLFDADDPLQAVEGIGPEVAASIRAYFQGAGRAVVEALAAAGVNMTQPQARREGPQTLAGKQIVVTGTIEGYSRGEIERLIKAHGGKPVGSVSRKTDFVVVGAEPGSKLDKARELKVRVVEAGEFLKMIGQA